MSNLLLLEDDISLIDGLNYSLKKNGFYVDIARTIEEAEKRLKEIERYDLLILDVTLPDGTGFDFCENVRKQNKQIPIIFLTASDEEVNIIRGLDCGGDDYVTKPFKLGELCSRIRALLRRAGVSPQDKTNVLECGDISIDLLSCRVVLNRRILELTNAEYRLLCLLVRNANRIVSKVGDIVKIDIQGRTTEVKIVGMLSDCPFNNAADVETIICSENTFQNITGLSDYTIIDMQLNRNATDNEVNTIRQMVGTDVTFSDERMGNESTRGIYYCMWLFIYGFLAVIAFITVFNIINNISLSVTARVKQYGAFRAIGLSMKQLTKMIIAEALTYTISGAVTGTILGLIFHKLLFGMMISYNWGDPWAVPWTELGIIVLIMLFSIIFAVYSPVKRLQKMSIVENISAQ